ncbi:TPA: S-type pyocin domain-containing protein [Yersinia enterocolitica]|uniref:S-type pyocin domain-containing protein n=1 Tax=Yersinia enterocolitica TaxID=630 RepID=UPI00376D6ABF
MALVKQSEIKTLSEGAAELRTKYEPLLVLQQSVNAELGIAEQQRIENERLAAEAAQWQQRVENARLAVEASFAAERQHIEDGWRVFEVAEKDAQLAAEAAQWQQRVENARLAIEATFAAERQRIEDRWLAVEAEAAIRNNTFSLIAYMAEDERFPGFSAGGAGSVTFSYREAIKLDASLQRILRRFSWHNSALADPLVFPIGTVFYSDNERQGTELPPLAGSFPLGYMLSHETSLPQQGEVNSPVRILMVDRDDETRIYAVKTGVADVPANVKVGMAQFDRSSGVYTFTTDTLPPRTFTFTSPRPPGVGGVSVIPQPASAPVFPQHTGTDIKILATRGTLTFLAHEEVSFHDYIIWFPAGSGLEPVYVYFNKPRKGVVEAGHDYHPAPKIEDITGFLNLNKSKRKTPKQGGSGKRERWIDQKGRKIYEWDSQHGELEGYRASDGQHLGAFNYKTGVQLKPADPNRNIKKYL